MGTLFISIDESGTFASSDQYFVFSGYAILGEERYISKLRKYSSVERKLTTDSEVKANKLEATDKQNLIDVMANEVSFAIAVKNKSLPSNCYVDRLSKALIKDDLLKNIILEVINYFNHEQLSKISIEIDEQNLKFGIRENLYTSLYKELQSGYYNRNQFIKGLIKHPVLLKVRYVDSANHPYVRAADIMANVVFRKLEDDEDVYSVLKIFKVL